MATINQQMAKKFSELDEFNAGSHPGKTSFAKYQNPA
jgi:hypothetical protein